MDINYVIHKASENITTAKGALLIQVVSEYLGVGAYDWSSLNDRFKCVVVAGVGKETYYIDEVSVIEIYPVEFPEIDGHISATFKYRKLI